MKVGDLVELSARGKDLMYCMHLCGKIGVVVELKPQMKWRYYIQVSWMGGPSANQTLALNPKISF